MIVRAFQRFDAATHAVDHAPFAFAAGDDPEQQQQLAPRPSFWAAARAPVPPEFPDDEERASFGFGAANPPSPGHDPDPWFHLFLEICGWATIALGCIAAVFMGMAGVLAAGQPRSETGGMVLLGSAVGLGLGSLLVGAFVLMAVDVAHDVRAMRRKCGARMTL